MFERKCFNLNGRKLEMLTDVNWNLQFHNYKSNILKCNGVPGPPYLGHPGSVGDAGSDGVEEGPQMLLWLHMQKLPWQEMLWSLPSCVDGVLHLRQHQQREGGGQEEWEGGVAHNKFVYMASKLIWYKNQEIYYRFIVLAILAKISPKCEKLQQIPSRSELKLHSRNSQSRAELSWLQWSDSSWLQIRIVWPSLLHT